MKEALGKIGIERVSRCWEEVLLDVWSIGFGCLGMTSVHRWFGDVGL